MLAKAEWQLLQILSPIPIKPSVRERPGADSIRTFTHQADFAVPLTRHKVRALAKIAFIEVQTVSIWRKRRVVEDEPSS
jgi:hypothetical protein